MEGIDIKELQEFIDILRDKSIYVESEVLDFEHYFRSLLEKEKEKRKRGGREEFVNG